MPESGTNDFYYIGDSIAEGFRTAARGAGNTQVGRSPRAVYDAILETPADQLQGKAVVLSTGLSNAHSEADIGIVEKQIAALKSLGVQAHDILILGVGDRADFDGLNDRLTGIARGAGATFTGPLYNLSPDHVHPRSYGRPRADITPSSKTASRPSFKLSAMVDGKSILRSSSVSIRRG